MVRVLITGGAGFLGQYLVQELARHGCAVSVVDLAPSRQELVPLAPLCARLTYGVDITRPETLAGHFEGVDLVYHLAGLVSFWRKQAGLLMKVNVEGTRHVLAAAQRTGVARLVHISSVAAVGYNNRADQPIDEDHVFDWSRVGHKHYMLSKHLAEEEVWQACRAGLPAVVVNPGLMWGPGDLVNSAKLITALHRGKVPACPPGGTNIVDVRDVAQGLVALRERGRPGQRYILGGHNLTFRAVYDTIAAALGVPSPRRMLPRFLRPVLCLLARMNESIRRQSPAVTSDQVESSYLFRYFSSAKAATELGWPGGRPFAETIRDAVAWLKTHQGLGAS